MLPPWKHSRGVRGRRSGTTGPRHTGPRHTGGVQREITATFAEKSRAPGLTDDAGAEITVRRSARRRTSVSAFREQGQIVVVVPARMTQAEEKRWVGEMVRRLLAREQRRQAPRGDDDLARRAERLAREHLDPHLDSPAPRPRAVRWVTNQHRRWGSCSHEEAEIRLSHRLQPMPAWVVDYVLVHELVHLLHADHSPAFWELVAHYPLTERARGYLDGWSEGRAHPAAEASSR